MVSAAQPVVSLAPTAPIALEIGTFSPNVSVTGGGAIGELSGSGPSMSMTTGGSAGAVSSVNGRIGDVIVVASYAVSLVFGTLIPVNAALGNSFSLLLAGSGGQLAAPINPTDGQVIRFRVMQGPGAPWSLGYDPVYNFGAYGPPALSQVAGKVDIFGFEYVASIASVPVSQWRYLGVSLG